MYVRVESVIEETPRVLQVRGLFELPLEKMVDARRLLACPGKSHRPAHFGSSRATPTSPTRGSR